MTKKDFLNTKHAPKSPRESAVFQKIVLDAGIDWQGSSDRGKVKYTDAPCLYIDHKGFMTYSGSVANFPDRTEREIFLKDLVPPEPAISVPEIPLSKETISLLAELDNLI